LGGLFGIFLFGETEQIFDNWWQTSGYLGRFTLMDWLKVPTGVIVFAIVVMAVLAFFAAEQLEKHFGKRDLNKEPKKRVFGAIALIGMAALVILIGTPTTEEKWDQISAVKEPALANREVQIEPAELYKTLYDNRIKLTMLDVRDEADYNLFHIRGAQHVPLGELPARIPDMLAHTAANGVYVVVSNDETTATQAWKALTAESVPNVYILGGGVNGWIDAFGKDEPDIEKVSAPVPEDELKYIFPAALGDRYECADPNPIENEELEFTPKIKLQMKRDKSGGGCG
jgi:rhodanese-related sulfurtransferase